MTRMPRDSRGWIVYEGDVLTDRRYVVRTAQCAVALKARRGCTVERGWSLEVDPDRSPERTNYERWFADLGTLSEVVRASYDICRSETRCWCECVLDCLVHEAGMPGCLCAFWGWLGETAVRL